MTEPLCMDGESARLAALARYDLLDTPAEAGFDEIVQAVRAVCRTPIALISLVDAGRQWFKARAGTSLAETPIATSVCALVIRGDTPLVIPDLTEDPRTAAMALVAEPPHLRFYAGVPLITWDGHALGSLCAIDVAPRPAGLTPEQLTALSALAAQTVALIEQRGAQPGEDAALAELRSREARALADSAVLDTIVATQRRLLAAGSGPPTLIRAVVEGALDAVRTATGAVVEEVDGDELVYRHGAGTAAAQIGLRVPIGGSLSGRAYRERRSVFVNDVDRLDPATTAVAREAGVRAMIAVPLAHLDETLGVLKLSSDRADAFRPGHILIAQVLAGLIAAGLVARAGSEARASVRATEQHYRHIIDSAVDNAIVATDAAGRITTWSRGAERVFGWTAQKMVGGPVDRIFTAEDRAAGRPAAEMRIAAETGRAADQRWHLRKDGSRFYADGAMTPLLDEPGGGFVKSLRDVTDEHATRRSLAESRERLELTNRAARLGGFDYLPATDEMAWDDRCRELFGLPPGVPVTYDGSFLAGLHPDDRARAAEAVAAAFDPAGTHRYEVEYRTIGPHDGIERHVAATGVALFEGDAPVRFIGTVQDVSENRRAVASLREAEQRLRLAVTATNDAIWDWELTSNQVVWNEALYEAYGHAPERVDATGGWWLAHIHPDDRDHVADSIKSAVEGSERVWADEYRFRRADGSYAEVLDRGHLVRDEHGRATRMIGAMLDQTERKRAQRALEEINETLAAEVAKATAQVLAREEQLRQAQKMEAVGQLTGGIAHDFNNMLTGVIGSLELLKRHLDAGRSDRVDRYIDAATSSAQRAAGLTHRLLAFSRRQSLDVRPTDVAALVVNLEDMLGRTLGENVGLEVRLPAGLWVAVTDANQLESALVNLAINARDAMPHGGRLTIEASNTALDETYAAGVQELAPGDYVLICVSDTGTGMTPEVIGKAFDPFFTTKPIGQGTGLGLSMIYGFIRQSGGHVRIYSEPGTGSTIKLYLPRHAGTIEASEAPAAEVRPADAGECVLVVEDEPAVRMLVVEVLESLGYGVIEAEDGRAAIPILEGDARIDLLVSDVGLPGLNGRQVAEIARAARPGLKVLFVTGYAEGAAVRGGFLDAGMDMIMKPFAIDALAAKIREMIEGI